MKKILVMILSTGLLFSSSFSLAVSTSEKIVCAVAPGSLRGFATVTGLGGMSLLVKAHAGFWSAEAICSSFTQECVGFQFGSEPVQGQLILDNEQNLSSISLQGFEFNCKK